MESPNMNLDYQLAICHPTLSWAETQDSAHKWKEEVHTCAKSGLSKVDSWAAGWHARILTTWKVLYLLILTKGFTACFGLNFVSCCMDWAWYLLKTEHDPSWVDTKECIADAIHISVNDWEQAQPKPGLHWIRPSLNQALVLPPLLGV